MSEAGSLEWPDSHFFCQAVFGTTYCWELSGCEKCGADMEPEKRQNMIDKTISKLGDEWDFETRKLKAQAKLDKVRSICETRLKEDDEYILPREILKELLNNK